MSKLPKFPTLEPTPNSSVQVKFDPFFVLNQLNRNLESMQHNIIPSVQSRSFPPQQNNVVTPHIPNTLMQQESPEIQMSKQIQQKSSIEPSVIIDTVKELLKGKMSSDDQKLIQELNEEIIETMDEEEFIDMSDIYEEFINEAGDVYNKHFAKEEHFQKIPAVTVHHIQRKKRKREPKQQQEETSENTDAQQKKIVEPSSKKIKIDDSIEAFRVCFDKTFETDDECITIGEEIELPPKYGEESFIRTFQEIMSASLMYYPRYSKERFLKEMDKEKKELRSSYKTQQKSKDKRKVVTEGEMDWTGISHLAQKQGRKFKSSLNQKMRNAKKLAIACIKHSEEVKAKRNKKTRREAPIRAKKLNKEMLSFWRKYEKETAERRKRAAKEEEERRKRERELEEQKRQQRKLDFLITQTEIYSHFMAKKEKLAFPQIQTTEDDQGDGMSRADALRQAEKAVRLQRERTEQFDQTVEQIRQKKKQPSTDKVQPLEYTSINAEPSPDFQITYKGASIFKGKLKQYQLYGLNWLISLYEQGINGILADEMGLGKTIQTIAFLAYLAEVKNIWGPFLIISPSSTLHNWQQEFQKFCPDLKVLPYWGTAKDRKVLRKFWNPSNLYTKDAPFHVLITSYRLVLEDEKMFRKIKWQYLILDEAHAIKSAKSVRWRTLLNLDVRNRMLLTGTPIQNNMAELWALLHFIMPSLFDSHEEFNEWFSKDIESHAAKENVSLDEQQLKRLHMILKPFMLRRVKKDVESELGPKTEYIVYCGMSSVQQKLYDDIKTSFSSTTKRSTTETALMNYVMQLRKVCNHPQLFYKHDVESPFQFKVPVPISVLIPKEVTGYMPELTIVNNNPIEMIVPKTLYRNGLTALPLYCSPRIMGDIDSMMKHHLFFNKLNIFSVENIHRSLAPKTKEKLEIIDSNFSFLMFSDMSPGEAEFIAKASIIERFLMNIHKRNRMDRLHYCVNNEEYKDTILPKRSRFLISEIGPTSRAHVESIREPWHDLVIIDPTKRLQRMKPIIKRISVKYTKVTAPPIRYLCPDRSFAYQQLNVMNDPYVKKALLGFSMEKDGPSLRYSQTFDKKIIPYTDDSPIYEYEFKGLFTPYIEMFEGNEIIVPPFDKVIYECGKMRVLSNLLDRLKKEGHRVLIFSQMTKMLDILEDFMHTKHFTYFRLDGSTQISDRNEMVKAFQTRNDIFAFLLSTRAGGLGINLTAADTVIFYDNDWNPTSDAQAMDRCHRIGQTKPVSVYRLVTKGTIEERVLQIAAQKSTIQDTVYKGHFRPEGPSNKDMISALLDDANIDKNINIKFGTTKKKKESIKKKNKEDDGEKKSKKRKATTNESTKKKKRKTV